MDLTILHLSDFHLDVEHKTETDPILKSLILNIQKKFQDSRLGTPFIILSGDLTKGGKEEQYKLFEKDFLVPLLSKLSEIGKCPPPSSIIFCPGNHDLDRDIPNELSKKLLKGLVVREDRQETEADQLEIVNQSLNSDSEVSKLKDGMRHYYSFAERHCQKSKDLYYIKPANVDGYKVNFVSLNSAYLFNPVLKLPDEKGGFIGQTQIEKAFEEARARSMDTPTFKVLNVVLVHHPFANLIRAGRESDDKRICNSADLVLCGDEHDRDVFQRDKSNPAVPGRDSANIFRSRCIFDKKSVQPGYYIINLHAESDTIEGLFWDVKSNKDGTWTPDGDLSDDKPRPMHIQYPVPPGPSEVQLVNQVEEMNLLERVVNKAVQGEGSVVFLCGDAGIGKTRIIKELELYARLCRMQVLHGRGMALSKGEKVPPYFLWREVIKDYLHSCTPEQLNKVMSSYPAELYKIVPEIKQKLGRIPESLIISPESGRDRIFESFSQVVANISKDAPLLIILDNLQWVDQTSLLLLHYVVHIVSAERLFLLGAYRSDVEIHGKRPLAPVLTVLNNEGLLQCEHLTPLSFADSSKMIRCILEQEVPKEFCDSIYRKTRGNPKFVEQVLESLKEEKTIYREEGKWIIRDVEEIELPKRVKEVVNDRIGRLDNESRSVLREASFVGDSFTFETLQKINNLQIEDLRKIVDNLIVKKGLLKQKFIHGEDLIYFSDPTIREVVYEGFAPFERKDHHIKVGNVLEKAYSGKVEEHFGELADHFLKGGDKEKALDYFLKAGERASKVYANNEADSYYRSALDLLKEKENRAQEKGLIHEKIGDMKKLIGEYSAAIKYWNEALQLFDKLNEKENVARLHRKIANALWSGQGEIDKAKIHHNEALKILKKEPGSEELAYLFDDMTRLFSRAEDVPKALSWAKKTLKVAQKLNKTEIIASSYSAIGEAQSFAENADKAAKYYRKALKIALENNYAETAIRAYSSLSNLLPSVEVFGAVLNEEGLEMLEKAYELAKKAGDIHLLSTMGANLAEAYGSVGKLHEAIRFAEEAVTLAQKTQNPTDLANSMNVLGHLYMFQGDLDRSEEKLGPALEYAYKSNDHQQITTCLLVFGLIHIAKGEYPKAIEYLEKMIGFAKKEKATYTEFWGKDVVSEAYLELGNVKKAKSLLDSVLKFASEDNQVVLKADADTIMGMLFRAQKKYKRSIAFFERSLREYDDFKGEKFDVFWYAQTCYEYAITCLERNESGDKEKAEKLLNRALEIFQMMGAKQEIEKTLAKKKLLSG